MHTLINIAFVAIGLLGLGIIGCTFAFADGDR